MPPRSASQRRRLPYICLTSICLFLLLIISPNPVGAHPTSKSRPRAVATVEFVHGVLMVRAPHRGLTRGKLHEPLFAGYWLGTTRHTTASIRFRDGSVLDLRQLTNIVLSSSSKTNMDRGEIYQRLLPGSNHRIHRKEVTAAAIGTEFDVKIARNRMIFTVVEGAVSITSQKHTMTIKNNQQMMVAPSGALQKAVPANAAKTTAWIKAAPAAPASLGENLALDANGGYVADYSSTYAPTSYAPTSGKSIWNVHFINDGRLDHGWRTGSRDVSRQWVTIGFAGTKLYRIWGVVVDPAALGGKARRSSAKDFELQVSTTTKDPYSFSTVLTGTLRPQDRLQRFAFRAALTARYVKLLVLNNYGGSNGIQVRELEVVGDPAPVAEPPAKQTPIAPSAPIAQPAQVEATPTATPMAAPPTRSVQAPPIAVQRLATPAPLSVAQQPTVHQPPVQQPPPSPVQQPPPSPVQQPPPSSHPTSTPIPAECPTTRTHGDPDAWTHSSHGDSGNRNHPDNCHK